MAFRVAVASSNGDMVDLHFGEARAFWIYDLAAGQSTYVEKRALFRTSGHGEAELTPIFTLLRDCDAVVVNKIGPHAARVLLTHHIRVFEAPYAVAAALAKLGAVDGRGTPDP